MWASLFHRSKKGKFIKESENFHIKEFSERTSLRVILKLLKGRTHLNNHHVLSGGNFPKRSLPALYIVDSSAFGRGVVFRYFDKKRVFVDFTEEKYFFLYFLKMIPCWFQRKIYFFYTFEKWLLVDLRELKMFFRQRQESHNDANDSRIWRWFNRQRFCQIQYQNFDDSQLFREHI